MAEAKNGVKLWAAKQGQRDNREGNALICTFGEKHEIAIIFTWENNKQNKENGRRTKPKTKTVRREKQRSEEKKKENGKLENGYL